MTSKLSEKSSNITRRKKQVFQLVAGVSLDGKIADQNHDFLYASSREDQLWLKKIIHESDVLIMGRKTYEKHSKDSKKPHIIFSKKIKGIKIDQNKNETYWFNDSKEELHHFCALLQYEKVTILGGSEIYTWFLNENLVTDIFFTLEPFIFSGGKNAISRFLSESGRKWKLRSEQLLNTSGTILLHYKIF